MLSSTVDPAASSPTAELLRTRVIRYALLASAFSGVFLVSRVVSAIAASAVSSLASISVIGHVVGLASMIVLVAVARSARDPRTIRTAELVCTAITCASYCALVIGLPQAFRPDAKLAQGLAIQLLGRAVYVPSSGRRTGLLAAMVTIPFVAAVVAMFRDLDPTFVASIEAAAGASVPEWRLRFDLVGEDLLWWFGSAAVSTWVSSVIYGLRREVRRATKLGQYVLEQKLGEGGMGVVYRAQHGLLRRPTAIKLLHPDRMGESSLARFEREVRATAALSHPNTVTIFDYGRTDEGTFYYAMELLDGATLAQVVALAGPMPPARVIHVLAQAAAALAEAHEAKLVHRDIKPENILLTRYGGIPDHVKVVDFGLVKELDQSGDAAVTREGVILGTPLYLPPEQIVGGQPDDPRSDLYALGAVGYFLLTGEPVFVGRTVIEICGMHLERIPEPPSARLGAKVPEDLERLVLSCLEKDPSRRPASARALEAAVRACASHGGWTSDDAARWWRDYGPELARSSVVDPTSDTVAVNLAARS
jgi:serine/threonine-protein kinase